MPAGQWDPLTWRTFDKFDLGKQKSSLQRVGFSFFAIGRAKLEPKTFRIGQKTQQMRSGSYLVVIFGRSRNQDAEIFKNSIILGSYLEVRINKKSICLASFVRSNTGRYFLRFFNGFGTYCSCVVWYKRDSKRKHGNMKNLCFCVRKLDVFKVSCRQIRPSNL